MADTPEIVSYTVEDFTTAIQPNSDVAGLGIFDVMMNSVRANVYEEYEEGRITGAEYAQVYLSAMNSAGDRALQFLLQKDKAALEANNISLQGDILKLQAEKLALEVLLADSQIKESEARVCKLQAEYDVLLAQLLKITAETGLVTQKTATEMAQVSDANVSESSVLGRQKALYTEQANAFQRDAEQKATKIMVDTWNIRKTTDEGTTTDGTGLSNNDIGRAVSKLMSGIGA